MQTTPKPRKKKMVIYGPSTSTWQKLARKELFFDPWKLLGWRLMLGLNQSQMGKLLFPFYARPEVAYWNYENYLHVPKRDTMDKLMGILKVTIDQLVSTQAELDANRKHYMERKLSHKADRFK